MGFKVMHVVKFVLRVQNSKYREKFKILSFKIQVNKIRAILIGERNIWDLKKNLPIMQHLAINI